MKETLVVRLGSLKGHPYTLAFVRLWPFSRSPQALADAHTIYIQRLPDFPSDREDEKVWAGVLSHEFLHLLLGREIGTRYAATGFDRLVWTAHEKRYPRAAFGSRLSASNLNGFDRVFLLPRELVQAATRTINSREGV